ncbi:hypothetical protein N2D50_04150 [Enterococcus faecalis]|uniref:hypothetical protein n=1 Tax=Enterococcus faecalis TaxID=1351 RepID=UPI000352741D|nr:hypothetical protein [Enterococcus faecalis]EPH89656.1 hypothetical protein D921_02695 [Enterococcus faecalis F01966]MCU2241455.1 hypothetical protein [Enterococcus faecalis]MDN3202196.1 hypothetical protein [Enterococcus faecalis]
MNTKQFYGEKIIDAIKEVMAYAKQSTPEERTILVECFYKVAQKQKKEVIRIPLIKLAEWVESLEG